MMEPYKIMLYTIGLLTYLWILLAESPDYWLDFVPYLLFINFLCIVFNDK